MADGIHVERHGDEDGMDARDAAAEERDGLSDARDRVANQRDLVADERDPIADERSLVADQRQAAADARRPRRAVKAMAMARRLAAALSGALAIAACGPQGDRPTPPPSPPPTCGSAADPYVCARGHDLVYRGRTLRLAGATLYPS